MRKTVRKIIPLTNQTPLLALPQLPASLTLSRIIQEASLTLSHSESKQHPPFLKDTATVQSRITLHYERGKSYLFFSDQKQYGSVL